MEPDRSMWTDSSENTVMTAAGQLTSERDNLLATRRLRRRRQKLQAPFKTYSGPLYLIPSRAGVDESVGDCTKNTGFSGSSVDEKIGECNVKILPKVEKSSSGDIMSVINSCLEMVLTMSNDVNIVAKHLFGSFSFNYNSGNHAGPSSDGEHTGTNVEVTSGYVSADGYEERLEAIAAYLSKEECNSIKVSTDPMQELEDSNGNANGRITQSIHDSIAQEDGATGLEKPVVTLKKTGSLLETSSPAKSQVHTMTSYRFSKLKSNCRVMLQGIKSVVQILKLAIDADRTVQRAMTWVKTQECELPEGIVAVVSDTAGVTSQSVSNALSEAEEAMMIHEELVKGFAETVRSSCTNQVRVHKDNTLSTGAATFEDVRQLVRLTTDISLNQMDQVCAINSTNAMQPRTQNDACNGKVIQSYDEIPPQASKTLLRATESSLCAMDSALTVLEILSVAELQLKATIAES